MAAKVPRGPHLLCYRCDSQDMDEPPYCNHCGGADMVAFCHLGQCAKCVGAA
jgi:hypothetical protein